MLEATSLPDEHASLSIGMCVRVCVRAWFSAFVAFAFVCVFGLVFVWFSLCVCVCVFFALVVLCLFG